MSGPLDTSPVSLYIAECEAIHHQCDRCGIPREWNALPMSTSQRVAFLAEAYKAQREQLGLK